MGTNKKKAFIKCRLDKQAGLVLEKDIMPSNV